MIELIGEQKPTDPEPKAKTMKSCFKRGPRPNLNKEVRFQALENNTSLDSDIRERMHHNMQYKDDTLFENIDIFRGF